jgi:non-ribosomal peptide synthetase-like protein
VASASGGNSALELADPSLLAAAPADIEGELAGLLRVILGRDEVPATANFFTDLGADSMLMAQFCARVRKHGGLPKVSMKDVYANPTLGELAALLSASLPAVAAPVAPTIDGTATMLAGVLREVLGLDEVPATANFFTDLGADSMLMAQFCARVRKHGGLPKVSMKDIYANPTLGELAAALAARDPAAATPVALDAAIPLPTDPIAAVARPAKRGSTAMRVCGLVQLLVLLIPIFAAGLVGGIGFDVIAPATGPVANYLRAVEFSAILVAGSLLLPIAGKWLLIGRFRVEEIPLWSPRYLRFWTVKLLLTRNPMMRVLVGSPLYAVYLRALGAKIGPGTTILSRHVPACPDLLTIGANTIVRRDAVLTCHHARAGVIRTGRVTLGADVVVGARSVLEVDTAIGAGGQLGHASALHPGQQIPVGERWCGSPAAATTADFTELPAAVTADSSRRRARFGAWQLLNIVLLATPLSLGVGVGLSALAEAITGVGDWGNGSLSTFGFYLRAAGAAATILLGAVLVGVPLLLAGTRALSLLTRPDEVHRMHGIRHAALRAIQRGTNYKFLTFLTGDSSLIVHYLGPLGWRLKPCTQTGTNFGLTVNHETPFAVTVGTGTVIADGLLVADVEFSNSSFRVAPTRIGAENFLGNQITYPATSRVGDNCLLATKAMVPIDGEMRSGVGLLGSPAFPIPRTVNRDNDLAVTDPARLRRLLAAKNRHNGITIALFLAIRWIYVLGLLVWAEGAGELYRRDGVVAMAMSSIGLAAGSLVYFVLVERAVGFLAVRRPDGISIYDKAFWRHERFWKVPSRTYLMLFNGTPWRPLLWRVLGVRIGKRVFDDGCDLTEKRFATVGDDVTLNALTIVQCHSQEDGAFKSDGITIGAGVTLGVGSFVHYGVTMGQNSELAADSFLMKGEEVPTDAQWGGNPARETAGFERATTLLGGIA